MTLARHQFPTWIFIFLIVAVTISLIIPSMSSMIGMTNHVIQKRGTSNAERISRCEADPNGVVLFNPYTGRHGKICWQNGQFYVVIYIVEKFGNFIITGFPKEKMSTLAQVIHYMGNLGYR